MARTLGVTDSRTNAQHQIPIRHNAILASDLKKTTGLRVHDPGLQNTTVVETGITVSYHDTGLLLFRGYKLQQLWKIDSDFEDMLHLLVWGVYPSSEQRKTLSRQLATAMLEVPDVVFRTIRALPKTTSPLPLLMAGLSASLASRPEMIPASTKPNLYRDPKTADDAIIYTIATYAVAFGVIRCHRQGIAFTPPSVDNSYFENLFVMAGLVDPSTGRPDPVKLSCYKHFGIFNSDHGMALSVFSALVTASSQTDPISCLITATGAAYGPLHFGATESAKRALRQIGTVDNVPSFIEEVKQGKQKLFGYGHRSYKGMDPRVQPIQELVRNLRLDSAANPLLKIAERIEQVASEDKWFARRGLYPNADFYGHFVLSGCGFEADIIPAAMLAQRVVGIMAHWREYMLTGGKLFRPSHIYTGEEERKLKHHL